MRESVVSPRSNSPPTPARAARVTAVRGTSLPGCAGDLRVAQHTARSGKAALSTVVMPHIGPVIIQSLGVMPRMARREEKGV